MNLGLHRTNPMTETTADVAVVGGGNAALSRRRSPRPRAAPACALLEAAPEEERGGNSTYTAGAMRVVFDGADALRALMPDLSDRELARPTSAPTPRPTTTTTWRGSASTAPTLWSSSS